MHAYRSRVCTTVPSAVALGHLTAEVADLRERPADQTEQRFTSSRWVGSLVLHHHLTAGCTPPPPHCGLYSTTTSLRAVLHHHLTAGCTPPPPHCGLYSTTTSLRAVLHHHLTAGCTPPPPHCRLYSTTTSLRAVLHHHLTAGCIHGTRSRWTTISVGLCP